MSQGLKLLWRLISIRAPLPSLACVSSYKDVVVVVLREKQHRFCFRCFFSAVVFCFCFFVCIFYSRIIKTISLYHETFTDPLQLPNRTPDQLLGLQLLYRKQTDLYAWKKVPMPGAGFQKNARKVYKFPTKAIRSTNEPRGIFRQ